MRRTRKQDLRWLQLLLDSFVQIIIMMRTAPCHPIVGLRQHHSSKTTCNRRNDNDNLDEFFDRSTWKLCQGLVFIILQIRTQRLWDLSPHCHDFTVVGQKRTWWERRLRICLKLSSTEANEKYLWLCKWLTWNPCFVVVFELVHALRVLPCQG